jgi:hypothetical protein
VKPVFAIGVTLNWATRFLILNASSAAPCFAPSIVAPTDAVPITQTFTLINNAADGAGNPIGFIRDHAGEFLFPADTHKFFLFYTVFQKS